MMQESSHIPVLTHQTWPIKAVQSGASGVKLSSNAIHELKGIKKPDVSNGLHKEIQYNNHLSKPLQTHQSFGKGNFVEAKESKVRWTAKNLTRKQDGKQLSNINSWLSSQKLDDRSSIIKSASSNGNIHPQITSGFDLAKLYPELSSKLGLIKSISSDTSAKSPSIPKNSQNGKGATISRSYGVSNSEMHENSYKNSNFKAINSNIIPKSSLLYDKGSGHINLSKSKYFSLNNDIKKNLTTNKNKEKLDLTKLSEDKLKKLISSQALNNKFCSTSPNAKCESKIKPVSRSKVTTVSLFDVVCDKTFPSSYTYPPASGSSLKPNKISILPKCSPPPLPNHEALSPIQLRVHNLYQDQYAYKSNLFPLGYESSESDISDDDGGESANAIPECLLRGNEDNKTDPSLSRNPTLLLQPYRQQVLSAKERLTLQENGLKRRWAMTRALLEAARSNPKSAASTVSHFVKKIHSVLPSKKKLSKSRSSLMVHRNCVYEGDSGKMCGHKALPGTRHCMRHITYNVDQQLFSQCVAKKEDNSLCRIPTFHLQHDFPLCQLHANESIDSAALSGETASKTKRPRKKSKMPILSRYGKRNKKRRRSSIGSSSIVPSTSVRPPINSLGVCLGSPHSTSPLTPHTSPAFSTPCSDPPGGEESEFEDEFGGMVGELPIEARDIQDVLNKIPEHEFSQILYGADGKLCEGNEEDDRKSRGGTSKPPDPALSAMCLDEGALGELISSSFNQQELNAISQVLSNMVGEGGLELGGDFQEAQETSTGAVAPSFNLGAGGPQTPPVYLSEDSNSCSVQSPPQGIPAPAGGTNSLLHPNSKLKVNPTL